jgi:hypothetical protein
MFMRLRGAAAPPMRRVAVGPEPAPGVWPRGGHPVDGAAVHAVLQTPGHELPTGLVVPMHELYDGLIAWLGVHQPTSGWLIAQGKAVATGLVPAFVAGSEEATSTYGMFEPGGVALLVRAATTPSTVGESVSVAVRVHGDAAVGERLKAATVAWDEAGRPSLPRLRVRAHPIEYPYQPRAGETVLMRPCTRLVLDWPADSRAGRTGGDDERT